MKSTTKNMSTIATANKIARENITNQFKLAMHVAPTRKHTVTEHVVRTAAVVAIFASLLLLLAAVYVFVTLALELRALVRMGLDRTGRLITIATTPTPMERANYTPAPAATRVLVAH